MDDETRQEKMKRFSKIWWKSRADAGKSQEYMALGLGVSKKTIQNWEKGVSSPDLFQSAEWFELLGENPINYYLNFLFPEYFGDLSYKDDDDKIEEVLLHCIREMPPFEKRQLLYLIIGPHGSGWHSLLQLFTTHCHTSLKARVATADLIRNNFEMEKETGDLVCINNIMPDISLLQISIAKAKESVGKNNYGYTAQVSAITADAGDKQNGADKNDE